MGNSLCLVVIIGSLVCAAGCGSTTTDSVPDQDKPTVKKADNSTEQPPVSNVQPQSRSCKGVATACSEFVTSERVCTSQSGCRAVSGCTNRPHLYCKDFVTATGCQQEGCLWQAACVGEPEWCNNLAQAQCATQRRCYWQAYDSRCVNNGEYVGCGTHRQSYSCNLEIGCGWEGSCSNPADDRCATVGTAGACTAESSCVWDLGECAGQADACDYFLDVRSCSQQGGCEWR